MSTRPKHWRFQKDYTKLKLSQLLILSLRAFSQSPRQNKIWAECENRYAKGEKP